MKTASHTPTPTITPLPWNMEYREVPEWSGAFPHIIGSDEDVVAKVLDPTWDKCPDGRAGEREEANAAFIVRAVNSHDALVSALEKAFQELCAENKNQELIDEIDSALSLANS